MSLAGRRALVTGASRGIGRAIALAFAEAGADVAVVARGVADLEAVAAEIEALGRRAFVCASDVTSAADVERLAADTARRFGRVEILVNNAGGAESHKLLGHPDELWHRMIGLNLTSVYLVTKAFLPAMIDAGFGRVLNVASTAARIGARYTAAYAAAKHGVLGLTRVVASEVADLGITVNAICPGYADTPMTDAAAVNIASRTGMSGAQARQRLADTSAQRRLIAPEEVAAVAVFLASDASPGITGQAIHVDGGAVMA
jgi:NAD(P)-dependent dehydrogenase (short-subunit alcohol dehydrogenase family)